MSIVSYIAPVVFFFIVRAGYRKFKCISSKVKSDMAKVKSKFALKDKVQVSEIIDKAKADVEKAADNLHKAGTAPPQQNPKTS